MPLSISGEFADFLAVTKHLKSWACHATSCLRRLPIPQWWLQAHAGKLVSAKRSDYSPQFPIRLMRKDFGLILNEAARIGVRMPATKAAVAINAAEAANSGEEDFSAVVRRMEQDSGLADRERVLEGSYL